MTNPVRIIGVDPGFDRLGIAVIEKTGNKEVLLFSACITTSKQDTFVERLTHVASSFIDVLQTYSPHELALEKLFFAKNQTTAINVAEVRGVLLYLAHTHHLLIAEYSPPEIKVAVTGYGKATKQDIAMMVPKILSVNMGDKKMDDELDAIAIALTHSAHRKMKSWGK
ncbi:MAG: crossover junction endodeoxyribonuclease RuvC, crossover junction endodeoxyribonuclease RuvC [Candidatus Parcubacteria bacterium]|jgi:crossover junction endodeoxyribonuclease RuvC